MGIVLREDGCRILWANSTRHESFETPLVTFTMVLAIEAPREACAASLALKGLLVPSAWRRIHECAMYVNDFAVGYLVSIC